MKVFVELDNGKNLYSLLKKGSTIEIVGFYTNDLVCDCTDYFGMPVHSVYQANDIYQNNGVANFIVNDTPRLESLRYKLNKLLALGVELNDILIASTEFIVTEDLSKLYKFTDYHRIPYIEYHVADHCNLNCKGCVHFAPLVTHKVFPAFDKVKQDLTRLKSIVPYIDTIRILGGEPLLNSQLINYLDITRGLYPFAEINIVTNGILLQNIDDALMNSLKINNIGVDISVYPPMFKSITDVVARIIAEGITTTCTEPISDFFCPLDKHDGHAKFTDVHHCACPNLYDGALYVCPVIAYLRYFNKAFGTKLNDIDGRIDIYDPCLTFDKLRTELHKVRALCDSCWLLSREYAVKQKWERTKKARISDYMTCQ